MKSFLDHFNRFGFCMLFKYMPDVKHVHTVSIKQDGSMPNVGSAEFKYAIAI